MTYNPQSGPRIACTRAKHRLTEWYMSMVLLVLLAPTMSVMAAPEEQQFHAGYELIITNGKGTSKVRSKAQKAFGVPIVHEIENYRISLTIDRADAGEYSLSIDIDNLSKPNDVNPRIYSSSRVGLFSSILEFEETDGTFSVSGAIAVLSLIHI